MSLFIPCPAPSTATVAAPFVSPPVELDGGDILHFGVMIEALLGAPSAATLAFKWQGQPIQGNLFNINAGTDGVDRPWLDIAATDGRFGHLLLDGDFPTNFVDASYPRTSNGGGSATYPASGMVGFERRLRGGAFFKAFRVVGTATFTGGTNPAWALAAGLSHQPHFGA